MTVGPLFTISAINVARAAVRQAEAKLPPDAPVAITVEVHDPADSNRLHVAVTGTDGQVREIPLRGDPWTTEGPLRCGGAP